MSSSVGSFADFFPFMWRCTRLAAFAASRVESFPASASAPASIGGSASPGVRLCFFTAERVTLSVSELVGSRSGRAFVRNTGTGRKFSCPSFWRAFACRTLASPPKRIGVWTRRGLTS